LAWVVNSFSAFCSNHWLLPELARRQIVAVNAGFHLLKPGV
jgi:hypothetical protein